MLDQVLGRFVRAVSTLSLCQAPQGSAFNVMVDMLDAMADALHFASSINGNT